MEYISSDTNIWIDFSAVDALALPFRLDCTYLMSSDALEDEWLSPKGRGNELIELGLQAVKITTEEFYYAEEIRSRCPKLSAYDTFALAIAKFRGIALLTGDGRLRKTAIEEGVSVRGTLWIFDELLRNGILSEEEYRKFMLAMKAQNGRRIRLPEAGLDRRVKEKRKGRRMSGARRPFRVHLAVISCAASPYRPARGCRGGRGASRCPRRRRRASLRAIFYRFRRTGRRGSLRCRLRRRS